MELGFVVIGIPGAFLIGVGKTATLAKNVAMTKELRAWEHPVEGVLAHLQPSNSCVANSESYIGIS